MLHGPTTFIRNIGLLHFSLREPVCSVQSGQVSLSTVGYCATISLLYLHVL
jgi:hypothetical protein